MSGTLSGSYSSTVTLSQNPTTLAAGGAIATTDATAVKGNFGTAWTIVNQGSIRNSGTAGFGVLLADGGSIDNAAGALLTGAFDAVYAYNAATTLTNAGSIDSTGGAGIRLRAGGTVTNAAAGTITGTAAIAIDGTAVVVNLGRLGATGATGSGVALGTGGSVSNAASGVISTTGFGVYASGLATVTNSGMIVGLGETGVVLLHGGALANDAGATISGHYGGVRFAGVASTLLNDGAILSDGNGIQLDAGGYVSIGGAGTVGATDSGAVFLADGMVSNAGSIAGTQNNGVLMVAGGSVENQTTGTITGYSGVVFNNVAGSVTNRGSIGGLGNFAVKLNAGGTVANAAGGHIGSAGFGVVIAGGAGTVANAGTIAAASAGIDAVQLAAGFANRVVAVPGAVFGGLVEGGNTIGATAASTLELASAAGAGALVGLGTQFLDFAEITVDAGAAWALDGTDTIGGGVTLSNGGGLTGGVTLAGGAALTNATTGTIAGQGVGVYGAGTVDNSGRISGGGASGYGIQLGAGSALTNRSGGSIQGAVGMAVASGTVSNAGTIDGTVGSGVGLLSGGSLTNTVSGTISGGLAGLLLDTGTVINSGAIIGLTASLAGIDLLGAASVTNALGGIITGDGAGVYGTISAGSVTLINDGTITASGTAGYGIVLGGDARIVNQSHGRISGLIIGVAVIGNATVENAGTIAATAPDGDAVLLAPGYANRLVVDPGAAFTGLVSGGNAIGSTIASTLELAPGSGTLAGFGSQIRNFGAVAFDAGAHWTISGSPAGLAGVISGFAPADTIELSGLTVSSAGFLNDILVLETNAGEVTLDLPGGFTSSEIQVENAAGGIDVSVNAAPCFHAGTRILTGHGEVAVEALRIGDRVATLGAGTPRLAPIVWLGRREIDCSRHADPAQVWPVHVSAGAFGPGRPHRELVLSPDHAVLVAGVLIPIRHLVNGATIMQRPAAAVSYWHVELAAHAILLAEGLPAESYLDTGNRGAFANGGAAAALHPDFALRIWQAAGCARLVTGGAELTATREAVLARAERLGHVGTGDAGLQLIVDGRAVPADIAGRRHRFVLPAAAGRIRLLSRHAVPAHVQAASDDHRRLGVAVAGIRVDGHGMALTDPRLGAGWHHAEAGLRWTDGDAELAFAGAGVLEIELAMTARYWLPPAPRIAARRG